MPERVPEQADYAALKRENVALKRRIAWFEKQVFGSKSERHLEENPHQLTLACMVAETTPAEPTEQQTVTYQRGKAKKQRADDCVTDTGLRFNDEVPVVVIPVPAPELEGPDADQYERIDTRVTHRLAQRPASYVVLRYEQPVFKRRASSALMTATLPNAVFEHSLADVSLLAGLLVDKFCFHLPLYRQHQRIQGGGITVSRATLTNLVKASIRLLKPIVVAQLAHVLQSKVLAIDETPIKAGRATKGKMMTGWFWPVYGEDDEIVFTYSNSRARQHIDDVLNEHFSGTLLSDGYTAYARYVKHTAGLTHAQCWVHTRRQFVEALDVEPTLVAKALELIGEIYEHETTIKQKKLEDERKRAYRLEHSKSVVDTFFEWCEQRLSDPDLLPDNPFIKAVNYALSRTAELRVFLADPDVQPDTNHLESALRPIPMGRRNWLFCWTELGAEHVGIIQSLMTTCRLHGVNPYDYLVDVLQRVGQHPASDVASLTPRLWKEKFKANPLRSDLSRRAVTA